MGEILMDAVIIFFVFIYLFKDDIKTFIIDIIKEVKK